MFDIRTYRSQVEEAARTIRNRTSLSPEIGIILGTGLGGLLKDMDIQANIPYGEIPHFPISTVESHQGRLLCGTLGDVPVFVLQGRFHLYEGYTPRDVTFPVRAFGCLGVKTVLISNAAGGMNEAYRRGDLMLMRDHINLQGVNPLTGPNDDDWGPRFPDMSVPYDVELRRLALEVADAHAFRLKEGVYVAVPGPCLETPAEYRFLHRIGGDAVGMSTVPEVIVARHMDMRVMGISVITDECFPDSLQPVNIADIMAAAGEAEPRLMAIMRSVVSAVGTSITGRPLAGN